MDLELKDIKEIRKKYNLTQHQLSKKANVSQSLIAKIESGKLDPTYSKTKKIFEALDNLSEKNEVKAGEIMNKRIIPLEASDDIRTAIKKMRKYDISQMPVLEDGKAVGMITETTILNKMADVDDPAKLTSLNVKDVMEECPPIITVNAGIDVISNLLRHYPALLVAKEGKFVGLIAKSDMLGKIYKG